MSQKTLQTNQQTSSLTAKLSLKLFSCHFFAWAAWEELGGSATFFAPLRCDVNKIFLIVLRVHLFFNVYSEEREGKICVGTEKKSDNEK